VKKYSHHSYIIIVLIFIQVVFYSPKILAQQIVFYGGLPDAYSTKALELALSHTTDKNYQVTTFSKDLPKPRAFDRMNMQQGIDVIYGGSTIEREANYLPVNFPLLRGLNGWRVPLVHNDNKQLFRKVNTLNQLRGFTAGQFHNWSDTLILESNQLNVVKASDYAALYSMLDKKRFEYFPRSVLEVDSDYMEYKHLNITINTEILIHYPTAYYFYLRKGNDSLAADIERGLQLSFADGSLTQLFMDYYGDVINKYSTTNAKVFRLENKYLSEGTPLDQKDLWIDLEINQ